MVFDAGSLTAPDYNSYSTQKSDSQFADESIIPLYLSSHFASAGKPNPASGSSAPSFKGSAELRARRLSRQVVLVNLVSLAVNLALAAAALYLSLARANSSATSAFAADFALDAISSAIILWRFHGDINNVYMFAREKIACIYLGALFEISALGIAIEAICLLVAGSSAAGDDIAAPASMPKLRALRPSHQTVVQENHELLYLALIACIAMCILTVLKALLFKSLHDSSILLDVINSLISTVFGLSIVISQALIYVDSNFWYLDPTLSIVLAVIMALVGSKVIYDNFEILKPKDAYCGQSIFCSMNELTNNADGSLQAVNSHIFDSIAIAMPPPTVASSTDNNKASLTANLKSKSVNYSAIN